MVGFEPGIDWQPDLEPEVPGEVIGRCCYHDRCVWGTMVLPSKVVAVYLCRDAFSVRAVSAYEPVESPRKTSRELWAWVKRYVVLRLRLHDPGEIVSAHPPPLRSRRAVEHVVRTVESLLENHERWLRARAHLMPETGWRYFSDESRCRSVFLVDPRYAELFLGDARRYSSRALVNVAFCDDDRCYPVWKGAFPSRDYLSPAFYLVRRDVVTELTRRYGAWSFWDYVDLVARPDEAGIAVYPGRRWAKVNLFLRVKDPAKHAVTLSMLQSSAAKVVDQLMLISAKMMKPLEESPGELELDWDALREAVEDYVRRAGSEKSEWYGF